MNIDFAQEFLDTFNKTYNTQIDNFSDLYDALTQKPTKDKMFYMHSYDIPKDLMKAGFINKEGTWVWFLCRMKSKTDNDIDRILFSMVVRDPKRLRTLADHMIKSAEKMERGET